MIQKECHLLMGNENSFRQDALLTSVNTHHMSWVSANIPTVLQVYLKNGHRFFFYFSMKRKLAILPAACQQVHFENVDNPLPNYMLVSPISPRPSPCTGLSRPWVFWRFRLPNFKTFRCMKVVRLSAPSTGRFYTPGNIPGIHVG